MIGVAVNVVCGVRNIYFDLAIISLSRQSFFAVYTRGGNLKAVLIAYCLETTFYFFYTFYYVLVFSINRYRNVIPTEDKGL